MRRVRTGLRMRADEEVKKEAERGKGRKRMAAPWWGKEGELAVSDDKDEMRGGVAISLDRPRVHACRSLCAPEDD